MYQLTIQSGAFKGVSWNLSDGTYSLGRGADCEIAITGDGAVSRKHCELRIDGQSASVESLSKRSLTLINGNVCKSGRLHPGDILVVGSTALIFDLEEADPDAEIAEEALITRSVSYRDAVYLGGRSGTAALTGQADAVGDLAELFRLGNLFSESTTIDALFNHVSDSIQERFRPASSWLAYVASDGTPLQPRCMVNNEGSESRPPDTEIIARVATLNEGALIQRFGGNRPEGSRSLLAVPLPCGGRARAVVALVSNSSTTYNESSLQFLLALGRAAGPCLAALERSQELATEVKRLRCAQVHPVEMIGHSPALQRARNILAQAAASPLSVLILGESGTGKELAARMLHASSDVAGGPYIIVNCAAIPEEMLESELFGFEKGAFTGASGQRIGLIEQAHGGTLFLDEIGDLSLSNQARLLRVLENGTFRRLGGNQELTASFRIVAATNKDIPAMVEAGQFREDLYHRVNGIEIRIPALRERPDDIPPLAEHFLQSSPALPGRPATTLAPEVLAWLKTQPWPGNARQLKNTIDRVIVMSDGQCITLADIGATSQSRKKEPESVLYSIEEAEKRHIIAVMAACKRDTRKAATILGVSRSTLYSKIKRYGIESTELPAD